MNLLSRIIVILFYPIAIAVRLWNALTGADPLRLKRPEDAETFWIPRDVQPSRISYFSEVSEAEGRGKRSLGWLVLAPLRLLARPFSPRLPSENDGAFKPAADREQGIPDEVYTLW